MGQAHQYGQLPYLNITADKKHYRQQGCCVRQAEVQNSTLVFQLNISNKNSFCASNSVTSPGCKPLPAIVKRDTVNKMYRHQYKGLTIELLDEPTYKFGSADNNFNYSKHYFGDVATEYPTSKHGIKIYQDNQIIDSCIIIGSGGATGVHPNSSLLDNDQLLLCCCNTVFCLTVPGLELKWKTQADQVTCFQIFKQQDDYIIHGELQVAKLGKDGNKIWEFGGADIFVSIDNEEAFKIENDGILLSDFAKSKYKIDFDGNLI